MYYQHKDTMKKTLLALDEAIEDGSINGIVEEVRELLELCEPVRECSICGSPYQYPDTRCRC